ncbi:MAG: ribonucleoside-diphosphate reductase alpha chain, partial [Bacteroidota bacterium]|nr:ribonucleoside-diphosphate reductase alpha chain [Bacteroidota bacterium]
MKFLRQYTKPGASPYDMFTYKRCGSLLRNTDGSVVFSMEDIEAPTHWSQMAIDILAQKYFRKTGVPQLDEYGKQIVDENGDPKLGAERSIKQVVHRLAGCWRDWGERCGYFDTPNDAQVFYDEIAYMLLRQIAAPNSPQWFNTGLSYAYGISGRKQGHYYIDPETNKLEQSDDAYTRPQPHACFIQSLRDDLVSEGGIFDLALREALIFKFGSGSGTNFSALRGEKEPLSGGGVSSGLMSFLKIFDRAAGAIKSGGTTRRAAKMVIVDIDHPDIEDYIDWKAREEEKLAAMVSGSKVISTFLHAIAEEALANGSDPKKNSKLNTLIQRTVHRGVPLAIIQRALDLIGQGYTSLKFDSYNTHFEGEGYSTVSGQNSNNSVRITNDFMRAVENDEMWELHWRTDGRVCRRIRARQLWEKINMNAWKCADPGMQFDTTINEWHTCPASGRINASNPCSEYMFLDDTACNLASLNLMQFLDQDTLHFKIDEFRHAVRCWTVVLEISVLMAAFPSKRVARQSFDFRTLGLGYANLGTLLMVSGIPYDSPEALALTGAISSLLTGEAYLCSAEMAKELGAFPLYKKNQEDVLRVIRNHRRAAYNSAPADYEGLTVRPMGINPVKCPDYMYMAARETWDAVLESGMKYGFRNAQVSVIAPTGTIGLVMDCDTTGIEPDFAVIKFKKLSGGGYFKIVNQSVRKALEKLGYSEKQIEDIERYCKGSGAFPGCPKINRKSLKEKGFTDEKIETVEKLLDNVL